ncbi:MAG TPA: hypothetical protein VFR84_01130 [Candidatus Angelobacter sp.]|nr:hypothetical protein [Candidatus Angelobacter sp.]
MKRAVENFSARESLPRDYTYLETVKAQDPRLKHGRSTDVFEIIEIKGHAFRRHVEQDGKKIARQDKQDDNDREKLLEAQHKILEEQIKPGHTRESLEAAVRKIMEDSGLKDWQPQLTLPPNLPSMGVAYFTQTLYRFKLPIEDLDEKFELKLKEQQILNGRATYVIQADPKHTKDKTDPAANFKMKVWIDQKELQIVKVEGEALRMGPLAAPEYSSFSAKHMSESELAAQKQRLAASKLYYGDDTKIVQEWTKVNDELWLLHRRHVKGTHLFFLQEGTRPSYRSNVEYDIEESNYKKFRVQHRFLSNLLEAGRPKSKQR